MDVILRAVKSNLEGHPNMSEFNTTFILYQRNSRFEVMHAVYTDLYHGFKDIGITPKMVEIKDHQFGESMFSPDFPVQRIDAEYLGDLLEEGGYILTDDNYSMVRLLERIDRNISNLTVWATYFYGHRFIFKQYRDLPVGLSYKERLSYSAIELMPPLLSMRKSRWYVTGMARTRILAQSLWTGLLINRAYSLKCSGVIYIPVDPAYYDVILDNIRELKCLIFFGNRYDTDLRQLRDTIEVIRSIVPGIEFEAFGNNSQATLFEKNTGIQVKFLGEVDRRRLSEIYNNCLFTICPIYNGNFEKVPVESLLNGTPVVSFIQPFMEVTGETDLVANIQNADEVRSKVIKWIKNDLSMERKQLRERILSVMGHAKVAKDFIKYLTDFSRG